MNTKVLHLPHSSRRALRQGFPLAAAVLAALIMLLFLIAAIVSSPMLLIVCYLAMVPVALASYGLQSGVPGLLCAAFFASAFLLQVAWNPGAGNPASVFSTAILLFVCVPVFKSVSRAFGRREALSDAAQERSVLLEHSADLNALVRFIREEAQEDIGAEAAALVVFNGWEGHWELVGAEGKQVISTGAPGAALSLPVWLAGQAPWEVIRDLEADIRFEHTGNVRSLLTRPLRDGRGQLQGVLVLMHSQPGRFGPGDLVRLDRLASPAEVALATAGAYARVGRAFERVAGQMTTIERTARDPNATFDPQAIARHTLRCALSLTGSSRGAIQVTAPGLTPVQITHGWDTDTDGERGLITPISLGRQPLGSIITGSMDRGAVATQDRQALATLAEHAAGALENARLYATVRNEREKSEQIIRNMADGLLTLDAARLISSANPAAEQLLGQREADLLGQRLSDVLQGDSSADGQNNQTLDDLAHGETVPTGAWRPRATSQPNTIIHLSSARLPPPDRGAVVLLHDITKQEELVRFQRELVTTFSHELRSPLANIDAAVQLLFTLPPDAAAQEQRQFLELVQAQSRKLSRLAERTLDVSRLDDGKWRLEPRPLAAVRIAEDAMRRWQRMAPGRLFRLVQEGDAPWALADEVAVTTVLDNLLDNAVKYAPGDSEVVVRVSGGLPGFLTVAVEDQGPGLAAEEAEDLFGRFRRGDGSESRRVYGYGLGLYVARRLVNAMGGQIWAEPRPEGGSRFAFTLPLMPETSHENPDR